MKIRVLGAVLNEYRLELYKEDGSIHTIKQGDPDLKRVLDEVTPFLNDGQVAEITIGESQDLAQEFKEFEGKTNGLIRFYKVVTKALKEFMEATDVVDVKKGQEVVYGEVPSKNGDVTKVAVSRKGGKPVEKTAKAEKIDKAIQDILAHAVPSDSPAFSSPMADQHDENGRLIQQGSETLVAVVGDTIIPGAEKLAAQVAQANKNGHSAVALQNFMARLGKVMHERRHSAEDLLKFLERGDLPLADDGCIVAYKVLKTKNGKKDVFYDCHTGLVPQKVGTFVHMDPSLVDPDRRNDCSNGLHIARRGYIKGFSGDVCVLTKIAPEDVIAVPQYDANKIRVCGYHIVDQLTDAEHKLVRDNTEMTTTSASQTKLGNVLAGLHVAVLEKVKIGGHKGTNITITPVVVGKKAKQAVVSKVGKARKAEALKTPKAKELNAEVVDATQVAKQVLAAKESGKSSRAERAAELFAVFESMSTPTALYLAAKELVEFKKKAKVSWDKLGINMFQADRVTTVAATEPQFEEEPEPAPVVKAIKQRKAAVKPEPKKRPVKGESEQQRASKVLLEKVIKKQCKKSAQDLLAKKRSSKKSWLALGLPKETGEACMKVLAKKK